MPKNINTEYDIAKALEAIEEELIASMINNLDHHRAEETKEGYEWSQWQVEQLNALEKYKRSNSKKYQKKFKSINSMIDSLISEQRAAGNASQEVAILNAIKKGLDAHKVNANMTGEFFKVNDRKMDALIKATKNDLQTAEHAMLRMANDKYRQVIFNAQAYAASGTTYEKAVDMATRDFLSAGINCVEYKNGARHTVEDYADMCIRTANKRAYLTGEGEMRMSWGISTVIMNKRTSPCPKCLPFVGKVLIDDVWSGGTSKDGPYQLMSSAMAAGLYHPRCKDSHTTYFEGISTPPDSTWNGKELSDIEQEAKNEARQEYAKRQEKRCSRIARYSLDEENKRIYEKRAEQWKEVIGDSKDAVENSVKSSKIKNVELPSEMSDIKGMTSDIEKAISDAFDTIKSEYNVNIDNLVIESLGVGNEKVPFQFIPKNVGGFFKYRVAINKDYYFNGDLDAYTERIMRNFNSGALASKSIEDLIAHEMAHVMTFQDCDTYGMFERIEEKVRGSFIRGMSDYADMTHDGAETIAEAFVRYRRGEELPDDVMELLNKYVLGRKK